MSRAANVQQVLGSPDVLTAQDVTRLTELSRKITGIELGDEKTEFICSRLERLVAELGLSSYSEYCSRLEDPSAVEERADFSEALTTNTTHFFRESGHYDWLQSTGLDLLGETGAGRLWDLTIWSAACSTGQELYSALMTVDAVAAKNPIRFKGIGTDMSPEVVRFAKRAVYVESEIARIPESYRPACLLSSKASDGRYRIAPSIRERAEWRQANLLQRNTMNGIQADLIFLRNVLIYFSAETQMTVLDNVLSKLRPGGILMTGHTETSSLRLRELNAIRPTIYQKVR